MPVEMQLNKDLSEKVHYNKTYFPLFIYRRNLSSYPGYSAISHWHDDVEFISVLSGEMCYNVNGEIVTLHAGEGIFVNARQLHYGFSPHHQECEFICALFHPILLCSNSYIEQNYVAPILENPQLHYLLLQKSKEPDKDILDSLFCVYNYLSSPAFGLKAQELFFRIWEGLFQLSGHEQKNQVPQNQHLTILKNMIRFISLHYEEPLTLEKISAAGCIGKTSCCSIFKKYTNQTPMMYLTEYRLKKAMELLLSTDATISEICFSVGFSGASYFSETFKKACGCTPGEYRRKITPD